MVKVKAPLSSLEACIIDGIKDIQANNIKFHNIAFDCWTIEDYEGRVFMRKKTGKWIMEHYVWFCSECGENPTKGMGYVQGRDELYDFCPKCGSYNGGEQDDSV